MDRREHLRGLEAYLLSRVLGQPDAVTRVSRALQAAEFGLNDTGRRPRASFLFMGPSGIGKTSTTKAMNEYLFGVERLTMLFMNEYKRADDVDDLVKAIRTGVIDHPEGTTFLFDEIEKAHKDVIDVFISLLDEGEITDADGSRISIAGSYVVLTSNIGAARWGEMEQTKYSVMEQFAFESARKILRPELFNRLTEVIVFRPLSIETQIAILDQALQDKLRFLERKLGLDKLSIEKRVEAHLLRKCFTQTGGARRLREELNRQLNIAVLPWAFEGKAPVEGRFYADPKRDQLELR
jgi:ATP-dependent Clp protease ATP-binding subunit ClpA